MVTKLTLRPPISNMIELLPLVNTRILAPLESHWDKLFLSGRRIFAQAMIVGTEDKRKEQVLFHLFSLLNLILYPVLEDTNKEPTDKREIECVYSSAIMTR